MAERELKKEDDNRAPEERWSTDAPATSERAEDQADLDDLLDEIDEVWRQRRGVRAQLRPEGGQ